MEPVFRLKYKYRSNKNVGSNGKYRGRTGNSHGTTPKRTQAPQGGRVTPPRRVYLGAATPRLGP